MPAIVGSLGYNGHLVTPDNLLQWCAGDTASISGTDVLSVSDRSGNGRHMGLISGGIATAPQITYTAFGSTPVIRMTTSTRALSYVGSMTPKHIFILAAYSAATFSNTSSLMSGVGSGSLPILAGGDGTDKFLNLSYSGTGYTYRKFNVSLSESNQKMGMSYGYALIELQFPVGIGLDGIVVGQDRTTTSRRWSGDVGEWMLYSETLNEQQRMRMYEYFARKYQMWEEKTEGGLKYFPFRANWGGEIVDKKKVLMDYAEDNTPNYRTKQGLKKRLNLDFVSRQPDEKQSARAFFNQHHPGTSFVYRDRTKYPLEEIICRFPPDADITEVPGNPIGTSYKLSMDEV
jgi:hypothetical protein